MEDEGFQLTLKNLYDLEKISDIETRNKVLEECSDASQISWRARSAAQQEIKKKNMDKIVKLMEEKGIKKATKKVEQQQYSGKYECVKRYRLDEEAPEEIKIGKPDEKMWIDCGYEVKVIQEAKKRKMTKFELERKGQQEKRKELNKAFKRINEEAKKFIDREILGKHKKIEKDRLWKELVKSNACVGMLKMAGFFTKKQTWELKDEEKKEIDRKIGLLETGEQMLIALYESVSMGKDICNFRGEYNAEAAEQVKELYCILSEMGWTFTTQEDRKIIDGTHELYAKGDKQ